MINSTQPRLILASTSPRRRELLTQAGIEFEVISPGQSGVDETPFVNEEPAQYVLRLAQAKARAGIESLTQSGRTDELWVLGADTTVTIHGQILEKPIDASDATRMLQLLSGKTHHVLTALALISNQREESIVHSSVVQFDELSTQQIADYIASGEPFDKAGGYGIQGRGARFIKHLEGSYSGVMGLPLYELGQLLNRFE